MSETRKIGQFEVVELLGEGGIGQVYAARDTVLDRMVAIKSLRAELLNDTSFVARFRAEAKNLALLSHPNITTLYSLYEENGALFMIMEMVRGRTLETILSERGAPFTVPEALAIVAQAADGLAYAHELGIVHRDIKPGNLIVTNAGLLKIMDFGIARAQGSQRTTRDGSIVGTLAYMSPEQCRGQDVDGRTDQYSLAIVLYEMLTGKVPFEASTDYDLMQAHINEPPEWPSRLVPGVAPQVERALMRALSKKASERFPTLNEFKDGLGAPPSRTEAVSIVHKVTRLTGAANVPTSLPAISAAVSNVTDSVKKSSISFALKGVAIGGGLAFVLAAGLVYMLSPPSKETATGQNPPPGPTKLVGPGAPAQNPYFLNNAPASGPTSTLADGPAPGNAKKAGPGGRLPFDVAVGPNSPGAAAGNDSVGFQTASAPNAPGVNSATATPPGADRPDSAERPGAAPSTDDEAKRSRIARADTDGAVGSEKDAGSAYEAKNYDRARELAQPCAKGGNPECQFIMGRLFENGWGGPKDPGTAAEWYRKAAEQGLAKARANLGTMYYEGNGLPKDPTAAALWFSRAASQGHARAQFSLARLYESGEGVSRDLAEARRWYTEAEKAADKELAQLAHTALEALDEPASQDEPPRRRSRRHRR
jgi:eukaryotic-like serine/threonine-protein kinase